MPSGARRAPGAALRCDSAWAGGGVKPASLWRVRVHQKFMSRPHDCVERFALSDLLSFKNSCPRRCLFAFACVAKWLRQRLYMPGVIGSTPIMGILPGREAISPAGVTPSLLGDMPSRCDMPSLPGTVSYILLKEFSDFRNERGSRRRTCPIQCTQGSPYPPDLVP